MSNNLDVLIFSEKSQLISKTKYLHRCVLYNSTLGGANKNLKSKSWSNIYLGLLICMLIVELFVH